MNDVMSTVNAVAHDVKLLGFPFAGLLLAIVGILFMVAKDPQKKEMTSSWAVNIAIGFAIVWLSASLVEWFSGKITTYGG